MYRTYVCTWVCLSKRFLSLGSTGITNIYLHSTYIPAATTGPAIRMNMVMAGIAHGTVCVCVLSRFLLHVVILEFLELALFNDTVAGVSRKHSHGVCMHKCTPCTASVLVCTHVTPYPSSPMLTVSPGISRKHFVQNRYLHTYTHTDRQ